MQEICGAIIEAGSFMGVVRHPNGPYGQKKETVKDIQPREANGRGKTPIDNGMRIDAKAELADMQSINPQEIKLMKFCQEQKDERLRQYH